MMSTHQTMYYMDIERKKSPRSYVSPGMRVVGLVPEHILQNESIIDGGQEPGWISVDD